MTRVGFARNYNMYLVEHYHVTCRCRWSTLPTHRAVTGSGLLMPVDRRLCCSDYFRSCTGIRWIRRRPMYIRASPGWTDCSRCKRSSTAGRWRGRRGECWRCGLLLRQMTSCVSSSEMTSIFDVRLAHLPHSASQRTPRIIFDSNNYMIIVIIMSGAATATSWRWRLTGL